MINWILQKNLTKPEILGYIKAALNEKDETWEEVEIIPFSKELPLIKNKAVINIPYGSTTFMLNACQNEDYKKGVFYNPATFTMSNYVEKWKDHVLNSGGQLILFGNIEKIKSAAKKKWFIRPNDDGKEFSGKVDTYDNLIKWSEKITQLDLPDFNKNTEVWMSEPKTIEKEWRLFIVDDEIISTSRYMLNGALDESDIDIPDEMLYFAKQRIKEYHLDDVYVMDIAEVENGFKIIECNCFNGTGFYKNDIGGIVRAVNRFVRKRT